MAFKRLSGRKNLAIDWGLSFLLSPLMLFFRENNNVRATDGIGGLLVRSMIIFYLLFLWSWRPRHIQNDKLVRRFLHTIFILLFGILLYCILPCLKSDMDVAIILLIWACFAALKYKYLFWHKNRNENDITLPDAG